jgi:hypothetical protein
MGIAKWGATPDEPCRRFAYVGGELAEAPMYPTFFDHGRVIVENHRRTVQRWRRPEKARVPIGVEFEVPRVRVTRPTRVVIAGR